MKKSSFLIALLISTLTIFGQLTIRVIEIPTNTPTKDPIHLAGNFQGWSPSNSAYQFKLDGNGIYKLDITPEIGLLAFKFTRGSWSSVEGDADGEPLQNRSYNYKGGVDTLDLTILSWQSKEKSEGKSTAQTNVHIIKEDFYIPQLNRSRSVWVYLPPDYETSQKNYPVLYMHDGQNVFDAATSYSGEWEVDETLNRLHFEGDYGVIVIAVDNGQDFRMDEYSPWINAKYGGGQGKQYVEFIVKTLKPYVDTNYRTLSDRKYTGLMGSSMGGLITLYGGIEYHDVFSKLGVFSPSYWFSKDTYNHVLTKGKEHDMKIYTIIGTPEGPQAINDVRIMETTLLDAGFAPNELRNTIHIDGQHSEWYWAREFRAAYKWLFGNLDSLAPQEAMKK